MTIFISDNFTLDELTQTDTGLSNVPSLDQAISLRKLSREILQPIRNHFGPVHINSGFRSQEIQDALTKKGYPTSSNHSQHLDGEAADIEVPGHDMKEVFEWIRKNLDFGQVIYENHSGKTWIHVSLPRENKTNQQALLYLNGKYENA